MEIIYKFVTGENIKVVVAEEFEGAIMQMDKDLYNNNQKETRRHQSFNEIIDKADMLIDKTINIDELILKNSKVDKLYEAISKLKPTEQELIHKLYLDKHPMTQSQYAKTVGITENAIKQRVKWLRKKLKRLLSTHI